MPAKKQPITRVEQIPDGALDQVVALANRYWQTRPSRLKTDPDEVTPLMACVILRAYLAVLPGGRVSRRGKEIG